MQGRKWAALLTACLLMLSLAGCGASEPAASPAPEENPAQESETPAPEENTDQESEVLAPDFLVYDLEGKEVHLSDFFGKPIVLNFWASWCGPCTREMPDFQEAYERLGEEVCFLMVNVTGGQETVEKASRFIEKEGYTFPVFYDTDLNASQTYGASALPTTFFIDAEGHLIAYAMGALSAEKLQYGIDVISQ